MAIICRWLPNIATNSSTFSEKKKAITAPDLTPTSRFVSEGKTVVKSEE